MDIDEGVETAIWYQSYFDGSDLQDLWHTLEVCYLI